MKAEYFMSVREIQLCRMTRVLFLVVGSLAGVIGMVLWLRNPLLIALAAAALYAVGLFVWERIARRIIHHKLLGFKD